MRTEWVIDANGTDREVRVGLSFRRVWRATTSINEAGGRRTETVRCARGSRAIARVWERI